jgi:hypothetical protein
MVACNDAPHLRGCRPFPHGRRCILCWVPALGPYIVEFVETDVDLLLTRSIYTVDLRNADHRALFSWDQGERPEGMHAYANGALLCSSKLSLLPGYPFTRLLRRAEEYFIDEGFVPKADNESILYHLTLPAHFVPCPDRPLTNPSQPNVSRREDRLSVTYGTQGDTAIKFWIRRLQPRESLADFELDRVLEIPASRSSKVEVEVNLGIFKFKFS